MSKYLRNGWSKFSQILLERNFPALQEDWNSFANSLRACKVCQQIFKRIFQRKRQSGDEFNKGLPAKNCAKSILFYRLVIPPICFPIDRETKSSWWCRRFWCKMHWGQFNYTEHTGRTKTNIKKTPIQKQETHQYNIQRWGWDPIGTNESRNSHKWE